MAAISTPQRLVSVSLCVFFALFAFLAAACAKPSSSDEQAKPVVARVETVTTGTLVHTLSYSGDIAGEAEVRVFSPIPDRIVSLLAVEGANVKAGDVLAVIRSSSLDQGVRQASGGLGAVKAQRAALEDQVERLRKLSGTGAVTSSQLLAAESQLASAEAQVQQLEATVGMAEQRKGDAIVRAPISGVIGQVLLEQGDVAAPQIPICTVVVMDRIKLQLRVPESDLPLLKAGQPVEFTVAADETMRLSSTVARVSPVLDRLSRTATIEVDYDNPLHQLRPGMLARVTVEVARLENVVVVPKDVLTVTAERKNGQPLYRAVVVEGGKAVERLVTLGFEEGARVEVLEGLKAGDRLVVEGQHMLFAGATVQEQEPLAPKKSAP